MRARLVKGVLLFGMAAAIGIGGAVGYWYFEKRGAIEATILAERGAHDHRDGATELTTSQSGQLAKPEHATDELTFGEFDRVRRSIEGLSPDDARALLESQLASGNHSSESQAQLEASLGLALLGGPVPDAASSRVAFSRAFKHCADADTRVRLAYLYGQLLYESGHHEATLDVLSAGRFVGARFNGERLAIEAIRGLALEALGRHAAARDVYEVALESAVATSLHDTQCGRDAARLIALRLARQYRDEGREGDAVAVSRMLRAWLHEDDLLAR
jgi:hypothetical protein